MSNSSSMGYDTFCYFQKASGTHMYIHTGKILIHVSLKVKKKIRLAGLFYGSLFCGMNLNSSLTLCGIFSF